MNEKQRREHGKLVMKWAAEDKREAVIKKSVARLERRMMRLVQQAEVLREQARRMGDRADTNRLYTERDIAHEIAFGCSGMLQKQENKEYTFKAIARIKKMAEG